ncbi:MAG: hypothetical protein OXD43_11980 [Bacteroidetes bacterium]|nr:hypothetical protein [Bacteroidota bacterium]
MSLLGHLVPRITSIGAEPVATQALAYILSASAEVAIAFVEFVSKTGVAPFTPGAITAEEQHGDDFPDLTIRDTAGKVRILIENKFWAGLTDSQPVSYLEALPHDTSSAVVFVVPKRRVYSLWGELEEKCQDSTVELGRKETESDITWARTGNRTLAITSWDQVLERLEHVATQDSIGQDINQLRGLTERMNTDEFLPLREDEVTDVRVARRLINYSQLIEEIVDRTIADGIATKKGLKPAHGYTTAGRYLRLYGKFGLWLGVDLKAWRDWGITPIWLKQYPRSPFAGVPGTTSHQNMSLFDEAQARKDLLYIPVRLKAGVGRDRVIDDAVRQMHSIAGRFLKAWPNR